MAPQDKTRGGGGGGGGGEVASSVSSGKSKASQPHHWNRKEYVVTVFAGFEWFIRRLGWPLLSFWWCPMTVAWMWYTYHIHDGSAWQVVNVFRDNGFFQTMWDIYRPIWRGSPRAWAIVGVHAGVQLLLMRLLPGRRWEGPMTGSGHVPVYKANGVQAFLTTLALFFTAVHVFELFNPAIVYDEWGNIFGGLTFFSFAFCTFLYIKGRYFPSTPDHSLSGNPVWDFYWGTELYPRVFGWDVKVFTNCRFGMMGWAMMLICYAYKQHELGGITDSMIVAVLLQLTYIFKFYVWESGYLRSLDIMHDRAGYYICWGCLVWLPSIYSSSTMFLVPRHIVLGTPLAATIFSFGFVFIMLNWAADHQRHRVRQLWFDKKPITVWGKKPTIIETHYKSEQGDIKETILLASGFWGLSRHFHYLPEILGSICWVLPCGFTHVQPWFYIVYLSILLLERGTRDDVRCASKYGEDWKKYCKLVPYRFIPGIF